MSGHLVRLQLQHERDRATQRAATPRQEPLPFGDGWLDADQAEIEFHGTNIGLRLHTENAESPCPPCTAFLNELIDTGLARKVVNEHG